MYQASAPVFIQGLKGLLIVLDKGKAFAAARKLDDTCLTQARLFPDMFPFARQVQIATDNAKGAIARLAGVDIPAYPDTEVTFDELSARVNKTIAFIESVTPDQIDGTEDKEIVLKFPNRTVEFKGADYLLTFATPNVYFHLTAAYALMRNNGVDVGKMNFLGQP
jgi:hypothetical protein